MRTAGQTHIPCLLLEATKFGRIGIKKGLTLDRYCFGEKNPPTFAHYSQGSAYPVKLVMAERVIEIVWRESARPQK
jgi:hypothetical protein